MIFRAACGVVSSPSPSPAGRECRASHLRDGAGSLAAGREPFPRQPGWGGTPAAGPPGHREWHLGVRFKWPGLHSQRGGTWSRRSGLGHLCHVTIWDPRPGSPGPRCSLRALCTRPLPGERGTSSQAALCRFLQSQPSPQTPVGGGGDGASEGGRAVGSVPRAEATRQGCCGVLGMKRCPSAALCREGPTQTTLTSAWWWQRLGATTCRGVSGSLCLPSCRARCVSAVLGL